MTAGQGPGPYGDPAGQAGASEQPGQQSGGAPQGQPPYGQPPYGQPPYGQPPYGQPPYGQPPYGQPPYGQAPYGQHSPYPGYGAAPAAPTGYGAPAPMERPLTVRAGIGAFVASIALSVASYVISLLNMDELSRLATTGPGFGDMSREEAEMTAEMTAAMGDTFGAIGLVMGLVFTGIFALFVWFAWRGHNWARIVLWVLAGLGVVFGVIGAALTSSLDVPTLPALTFLTWVELVVDAVAIVLLALSPSNEWYRYRGWLRATGQPG